MTTFLPYLSPIKTLSYTSLYSPSNSWLFLKFILLIVIACTSISIYKYIPKYNLFSLVNATHVYDFRTEHCTSNG